MGTPKGKSSPKEKGSPKGKGSTKDNKSPKSNKSPKGKKGSNGKGDTEPPVNNCMQTDSRSVCYLCGMNFKDAAAVQAHLLLMDHRPPFNNMVQQCRVCNEVMVAKCTEGHKCATLKAAYLRYIFSGAMIHDGPPYKCLLCRSRPFSSRSALIVHLLAYHRPQRTPGICGLCDFAFKEPKPPKTKLPAIPKNADEEAMKKFTDDLRNATELSTCAFESAEVPEGHQQLDIHCQECHNSMYELLTRRVLKTETHLRVPYGCVLCNRIFDTNVHFQSHILCRHGVDEVVKEYLRLCAMCSEERATDKVFDGHVQRRHERELEHLSNLWQNNELMLNIADCGQTCATCWLTFKNDFEVQSHILVTHVGKNPLICGLCDLDFTACFNPITAFRIFRNHEFNHARSFHQLALDSGRTFDPIPEPLTDDFSVEAIAAAIAAEKENMNGTSKKGKKSPKSKSSKEKSKKGKSSSKSKNGK